MKTDAVIGTGAGFEHIAAGGRQPDLRALAPLSRTRLRPAFFRLSILIDWQGIPLYLDRMADPTATAENGTQEAPATLGDVLYAKSKPSVAEQDWLMLVQSIAAGDQFALHALYDRAHRVVFTLAMRITANRETAEEVTIDVFHAVWREARRYDAANGTVIAWIMNLARSRAIDRLRSDGRKKRTPGCHARSTADPVADQHDILALRMEGESLRTALAALTPGEREAIEATFFAELTHAEAAQRLNQPLGTIKTRIRSGLHKLRNTLTSGAREP